MAIQRTGEQMTSRSAEALGETGPEAAKPEFPVREYIGAMALELAQMARWDGDEALGQLLDRAAALAGEPLVHEPIEIVARAEPRPS